MNKAIVINESSSASCARLRSIRLPSIILREVLEAGTFANVHSTQLEQRQALLYEEYCISTPNPRIMFSGLFRSIVTPQL